MDLQNHFFVLLLCLMISLTQSVRYCGQWICHGAAYCCGAYLDQCCFYSQIYQFWWFWLIWAGVFFILASCSYLCWRQRTEHSVSTCPSNRPRISSSLYNTSLDGAHRRMSTPPPPYQNYQTYDVPGQAQPPVVIPVPPAYEEANRNSPLNGRQENERWTEKIPDTTYSSSIPCSISTTLHSLNTGRIV